MGQSGDAPDSAVEASEDMRKDVEFGDLNLMFVVTHFGFKNHIVIMSCL